MNQKVSSIWKETVMVSLRYYPSMSEANDEDYEAPVTTACVPAKI
jgi:hypothetical protein